MTSTVQIQAPAPTQAPTQAQLAALAGVFHLMGDPSRLSILMAVLEGPRPVGGIAAATGLSASLVSHHLRLLRGGRLVRGSRRGKQVARDAGEQPTSQTLVHPGESR